MTPEQIRKQLDTLWANKPHTKLDWIKFEQLMADILNAEITSDLAIRGVSEALDAFTRRGYFTPDRYFPK